MSNTEKVVITAKCQRFIDEVLKPKFLPAIRPTQFNYPINILGKWHGNRYRFVQRYRSGQPETLDEEFDSPFTRLEWMGHDRDVSQDIVTAFFTACLRLRWSRLSEQIFRVDKWSVCRG
jgi:hypothetical protein